MFDASTLSQEPIANSAANASLSSGPQSKCYFVGMGGERRGPYTLEALLKQQLERETLIWRKGLTQWLPAMELPELQDFLSESPPPMPASEVPPVDKDIAAARPEVSKPRPASVRALKEVLVSENESGSRSAGDGGTEPIAKKEVKTSTEADPPVGSPDHGGSSVPRAQSAEAVTNPTLSSLLATTTGIIAGVIVCIVTVSLDYYFARWAYADDYPGTALTVLWSGWYLSIFWPLGCLISLFQRKFHWGWFFPGFLIIGVARICQDEANSQLPSCVSFVGDVPEYVMLLVATVTWCVVGVQACSMLAARIEAFRQIRPVENS